jgi:hypothetical protein
LPVARRIVIAVFGLSALAVLPSAAQQSRDSAVTMPSGDYVISARDTSDTAKVAITGWPFQLKGNGNWTITAPDGSAFTGTAKQQDGQLVLTDQTCADSGVYVVHRQGKGYVWDVKSEACQGRDTGMTALLFTPGKPDDH